MFWVWTTIFGKMMIWIPPTVSNKSSFSHGWVPIFHLPSSFFSWKTTFHVGSPDLRGGWCWIGTVTWMEGNLGTATSWQLYIYSVWYNHIHVCICNTYIGIYIYRRACIHYTLRYVTLRCATLYYITFRLHYITLHVKPDTWNLHNRFLGFSVQVDIFACGRVIKSIFQNWRPSIYRECRAWWNSINFNQKVTLLSIQIIIQRHCLRWELPAAWDFKRRCCLKHLQAFLSLATNGNQKPRERPGCVLEVRVFRAQVPSGETTSWRF